jgi:hypothetical protein
MTIIKTHIVPLQNDTFRVAFIYPEDKSQEKTYVTTRSEFDTQRTLDFMQKNYFIAKLTAWVNQRAHARPDLGQLIINMQYCLAELKFRHPDYTYNYIKNKKLDFESLAPFSEKSRCFKYYTKAIAPILDCCSSYTPKE